MYAVFYIAVTAFISSLVVAAPSSTAPQGHIDEFVRRDADAPPFVKRAASCTFPIPPKTSSLSSPITVTGTFDGLRARNVVIGANQAEVVHCLGPCNLYNVWFEDVCEDAITIKQTSGQSNIIGGGAKSASNKVVQHNGGGTVKIDSYCVQSFGKLYRSCGNCSTQYKHTS
ncbi:pectate lyase [Rhizoctonia solani]|uniref:Pectate lyase n=1 Tax=Rhizoctonia solani TaxID=456999 RepID=A0A8H8P3X4_9AGAM|nr:pectate lyase [Rhizoctonia solani]QRW24680.1 pectate lyase [Rhizoctonia solani]